MARRDRDFQKNSRQSVRYLPKHLGDLYTRFFGKNFLYNEHGTLQSYVHMFWEDVRSHLFPYFKNKDFLSVSGSEANVDKVRYALDSDSYNSSDAMWRFTENNWIVSNLLIYGKCYLEIVYNDKGDFTFESIDPETLFRLTPNHIYQYIPEPVRKDKNLPTFKKLNSKNIFCIKLSPVVRKNLKGVMKELASLSSNFYMPKFANDDLMNNGKFSTFDRSWYTDKNYLRLAKITRNTGWMCRDMLSRHISEYYGLHRRLRFDQFLNDLRQCVIEGLNEGFGKVSVENWELPNLKIKDIPDENDVMKIRKLLESGSADFRDIYFYKSNLTKNCE